MIVVIVEVQKSSMTNIASCQLVRAAAAAACCWPGTQAGAAAMQRSADLLQKLGEMAWALSARKSAP